MNEFLNSFAPFYWKSFDSFQNLNKIYFKSWLFALVNETTKKRDKQKIAKMKQLT